MSTRWSPFAKQLVVIGGLLAVVWFLARISILLPPIILALLLAYLISFPVGWLIRQTGAPRGLAVALFYLLVVVILIVGPVLLVPRMIGLLGGLSSTLRHVFIQITEATPQPIVLTPSLTIDLGPLYAPVNQWVTTMLLAEPAGSAGWQSLLFPFAGRAVSVVRGAVNSLVSTVVILAVSFYVVLDAPAMGRFIASRVPERWQPELDRLWRQLAAIWDAYIRGQIILGALMALLTWAVTSILGLRNSAALGLMAFLAEFVPGVGHVVAAIVAIIIALATGSNWLPLPHLWFAVVVTIAYFLMSQFENIYLLPRIIGQQIALHPVVVILGALAGAHVGGVLGILLAAPIMASVRVLFGYVFHKVLDEEPFPLAPELEAPEQGLYWRGLLRERPVGALIFDLDGTLLELDDERVRQLAVRLSLLQRLLPAFLPTVAARRLLIRFDALVNELITLLNQLRLERLLSRLNQWLRRLRAYRAPSDFLLVPGTLEGIRSLAGRYPLALLTTRSAPDAAAFLARFDLARAFQTVVTREDVRLLEPHPAPVKLAAKRLNVPVQYCVVIGDAPSDLRAAKAAGAIAVGVLSGLGETKDLRSADLVISSVADLCRSLPPVTDQEPVPEIS